MTDRNSHASNLLSEEALFEAFQQKRYAQCVEGLRVLADQGNSPAAIALAHIFFYGGGGVRKNYEAARHWLELINQDEATATYAAYRLGIIYYKGLSVPPNHLIAYQLFRKAALQGDPKSLLMVAAMQKEGDGVAKKKRSAKTIFAHCARDKRLCVTNRLLAFFWMLPFVRRW